MWYTYYVLSVSEDMENKTDKVPTHLGLTAGSEGRKTRNKQVNKTSAVWKIRRVRCNSDFRGCRLGQSGTPSQRR